MTVLNDSARSWVDAVYERATFRKPQLPIVAARDPAVCYAFTAARECKLRNAPGGSNPAHVSIVHKPNIPIRTSCDATEDCLVATRNRVIVLDASQRHLRYRRLSA